MCNIEDYEICLSIQRALLDAVTSALRRVSFSKNDKNITLFFFYDGKTSEIEKELVWDIAAEVISDFPQCIIDSKIEEISFPNKINSVGRIVYSRKES